MNQSLGSGGLTTAFEQQSRIQLLEEENLNLNMMQNQAQLIKSILHALNMAVVKIQKEKLKFYLYSEIHQLKPVCPLLNYIF
jgi:hypothetical protein